MNSLELFFEGWLESKMRKHGKIQTREDVRLTEMYNQLNTLDQTAEEFEYRMECAALEFENWIKSKAK